MAQEKNNAVKLPKMSKQVRTMNDVRNNAINTFASLLVDSVKQRGVSDITLEELEQEVDKVRNVMLFLPDESK